jgi:hypothetical protein
MRDKSGKFLAMVCGNRSKDQSFVWVKVDLGQSTYFSYQQIKLFESRDTLIFAYYFDSLMTTIREFRTIKCCEFFKTGDVILNPSLAI